MNLVKIQQELKAPKGQTNSFGKYKYRSAEDIIEAAKESDNKIAAIKLPKQSTIRKSNRKNQLVNLKNYMYSVRSFN